LPGLRQDNGSPRTGVPYYVGLIIRAFRQEVPMPAVTDAYSLGGQVAIVTGAVAYAFNYLLSPAAAWVTGIHPHVNGGGIYQSKMPKGD
jgi:hypothetical protein